MKKTERTPQTQTTSTSNQSSFPNAGPIPNFSKPLLTAANIPVPKYEEFYTLTEAAKRNGIVSAYIISDKEYKDTAITDRYQKNSETSKVTLKNKIKTYYNHFISEDNQEKELKTVVRTGVDYLQNGSFQFRKGTTHNTLKPTICYPAELARRRVALGKLFLYANHIHKNMNTDDSQDAYMRALRDLLKLADTAQALKKQLEESKKGIIEEWKKSNPATNPQEGSLDWINTLYTRAQTSLDSELQAIGQVFIDSGIYGDQAKQRREAKIRQDISSLDNRKVIAEDTKQAINSIVISVNAIIANNMNPMLLTALKASKGTFLQTFIADHIKVLFYSINQLQQKHPEDEEKAGQITDLKISINRLQNLYTYLNGQDYTPTKEDLKTLNTCLNTYSQQLERELFSLGKDITTHQGKLHIPQHLVAIDYAKVRLNELETQAENKRKDKYIAAHKAEYEKLLVDKNFLAFIILVAQLQKQKKSGIPAQKPAAGQSSQELLKLKEAEIFSRILPTEGKNQITTMLNDIKTQAQMNAAAIPEGLAPDRALETLNMNLKVNDVMIAATTVLSVGIGLYNPAMAFAAKNLITVKHNRQERLKQYNALEIKKHWAMSKHLHGLDPVQAFRSLGAGFGLVESVASTTTSAAKGLGIFGAEQINFMLSLIPGINAITGGFKAIAQGIDWRRSYKKMKAADNEIIVRFDRIKEREKNNKNAAVRLLIDGKETADKKEKKDNPSIDELKKRIGETKTTKDKKTRIKTETSILQTRVNELLNNKEALSSASVKDLNEILSFYNLRQIHNTNRHASKFGTISSVAGALAGGMQAALAVSLFLNPEIALPALALGGLLFPVSVGLSVANSFVQQNAIHKMEQLSKESAKFNADITSAITDIASLKPLSELKDNNSQSLNTDEIADTLSVSDLSNKLKALKQDDRNRLFREYVPVYRKLSSIPVSIKGVDMDVDIITLAANGRPKKDEIK